jgi:signal transduction histidine kinase
VDFLAWELRPSVLDDVGLVAAMKKFVEDWSVHFTTPAAFENVGLDGEHLMSEIEINLYRIVQEALNNIAKHAEANMVSVVLERRDGIVSLIIEDDGSGFDPDTEAIPTGNGNGKGLGLLGMKERAELVGGTAEIETAPGKGTTVFVRVPATFDEAKNGTS